uniref:Uncharacterized protein n=1 Tax=Manihot esculenta TaxID=3983 RepID=A0A2C9WNM9_MANES
MTTRPSMVACVYGASSVLHTLICRLFKFSLSFLELSKFFSFRSFELL